MDLGLAPHPLGAGARRMGRLLHGGRPPRAAGVSGRGRARARSRIGGVHDARAFRVESATSKEVDPFAGVFAGLAMGLNVVVTPAIIPAILPRLTG